MSVFSGMNNDPRRSANANMGMSNNPNTVNVAGAGSGMHGQNNIGTGQQAQAVLGQYAGMGTGQTFGPNSGNQGTMRNGGQSGSIVGRDQNGNPIYGMAGAPQNGMVGSPNLGTASELLRWASQVPGGSQYLQSIGMMPNVQTTNVSSGSSGGRGLQNSDDPWQGAQLLGAGSGYAPGTYRLSDGSLSASPNSGPPAHAPLSNSNSGSWGSLSGTGLTPSLGGTPGGSSSGGAGDVSGALYQQLQKLFANPSGLDQTQQQSIVNEAQSPYAQQQQQNAASIQEDAIRRGASGSGGDADIRSQLNESNMAGAADQQNAATNARLGIQQQGTQNVMGALGAGNQLYGNQVQNANSIRQMQVLMQSLAQQNGPLAGLASIMGGH